MVNKLIIFDFDGVLVDSFDAWYKINACAFKKTLGKNLARKQYRDFFMADLNKGLKKFAKDEKNYQKLKAFKEIQAEELFTKYYSQVKLFPFTKSLISQLKKANLRLALVTSSTNPSFTKKILKKFKIEKDFDLVLSSKGEGKISQLRQVLRSFNLKPKDVYFIADTYNDINYGKKIGLKTLAVLWGFHKKKILSKGRPDFIIKNYKEIIKEII